MEIVTIQWYMAAEKFLLMNMLIKTGVLSLESFALVGSAPQKQGDCRMLWIYVRVPGGLRADM